LAIFANPVFLIVLEKVVREPDVNLVNFYTKAKIELFAIFNQGLS
jgi:hypothetical protein